MHRKFLLTALLWLTVYAVEKRTKAWRWCAVFGWVVATPLTYFVLTRPAAEIVLPSPVSRPTTIEVKYEHIPADQRLWLVIKGVDRYWPSGTCDLEKGSLIEQSRPTTGETSGVWSYRDLFLGRLDETGVQFTLVLLLVDDHTDRTIAEKVRDNAENCTKHEWGGLTTLPPGKILAQKVIHRRSEMPCDKNVKDIQSKY